MVYICNFSWCYLFFLLLCGSFCVYVCYSPMGMNELISEKEMRSSWEGLLEYLAWYQSSRVAVLCFSNEIDLKWRLWRRGSGLMETWVFLHERLAVSKVGAIVEWLSDVLSTVRRSVWLEYQGCLPCYVFVWLRRHLGVDTSSKNTEFPIKKGLSLKLRNKRGRNGKSGCRLGGCSGGLHRSGRKNKSR